jgi:hypothetical protein
MYDVALYLAGVGEPIIAISKQALTQLQLQ